MDPKVGDTYFMKFDIGALGPNGEPLPATRPITITRVTNREVLTREAHDPEEYPCPRFIWKQMINYGIVKPAAPQLDFDAYLSAALLPEVRFSFERYAATVHKGDWTDVATKAKRLVQEGKVTILRNAPHHIMAHVIGDGTDNGGVPDEHDVEITRSDPNSQTIEQWNCDCAWAGFSWDRTRKWKKFEGRPCSHVIATYWKARSTPIDMEGQEPGMQVPRGQKGPAQPPAQQQLPGVEMLPKHMQPDTEQRQFSPEEPGLPAPTGPTPDQGPAQPPPQSLPTQQDLTLPKVQESPFTVPKTQTPQREQLQLFDITAPPGSSQVPQSPVSVPGGSPPTPGNPVKFPGTFSHWIPVIALHTSHFVYAADDLTEYFETQRAANKPIYVAMVNMVALEQSGGKIPVPGAQPYSVNSEGIPMYRVLDLGWNPMTNSREKADVNVLQGAPEQTGTYADVTPGKYAEVIDYDPTLKMAYVNVPLSYPDGEDARLHPHSLKGWVDYKDIRPVQAARSPFRRKNY